MFGIPFGFVVEALVAILLATTIGYCIILNQRLKRLHADRGELRKMVTDLVSATSLANAAIQELKTTAQESETVLAARLEEAEKFGIELANHVNAGTVLMERIAKITSVARHSQAIEPVEPPNKVQNALQQLSERVRSRGAAA